eukprot:11495775-Ditylum_brightwellii.AAC.1
MADLNSLATVKGLVKYYGGVCDCCLHENGYDNHPWADAGWPKEKWPVPWMGQLGPILCNDGSPTFALLCLQSDPQYQAKKSPLNGAFHTMLESHCMHSCMFGESHLREIWQTWCPTTAQLDGVMNPGNPNQAEEASDASRFIASLKLLSLLFTTNHVT